MEQRTSHTSQKRWWRLLGRLALSAGGAGLFLLAAFFVLARDLPSVGQIETRRVVQSTKIFDRTSTTLLYEASAGQRRTVIPFAEIPSHLKDATIAIEDDHFYESPGFDWRGILRALWVNVTRGRVVQGGSTITQQLARNAFLTPEQTITRKIRELILAVQLSRHYSKDQILAFYLNEIPYGSTLYGAEAASEAYFGKHAKDLSLAESALLAALPKGPSYYSPYGTHVEELYARQRYILEKMHELGKIDAQEFEAALAAKPIFLPQKQSIVAPHFVIAVQEHLVAKYGEDLVRTGGLRVVTTLDANLQALAEKAVADGAKRNEELYQGGNAALVAEEAASGQILAMVGSRDYFDTEHEGNFNVATQGLRQPGSALKPFVYLTAFQKGYTSETVVFDVPTEFGANNSKCPSAVDFSNEDDACFHPHNFDEQFRGPVPLRQALAQSINIPAVKMLYLAGLEDSLETLRRFGVATLTDPSRYGLSLVLGGGEVTLADLVAAYAVLAQDGVRRPQTMILEVRDSEGNVLEAYEDKSEAVFEAQYVRMINDILSDTGLRAGLFQSSLSLTVFPDHDVALKTGTSNDYRDAWAMGYTPTFVVGVWAGNNDNTPMQRHGSSILAAVPILHAFLSEALKSIPPVAFARPETERAEKQILRGEYVVNNEIHSILSYVDRRNPLGPPPANPVDDPQFINWEAAVLNWVSANLPGFAGPSGLSTSTTLRPAP